MDLVVGGYRLVRKIALGSRSEVFLTANAAPTEDPAAAEQRVLKLIRPGVSEESVEREISALSDAASPHLLPLREVLLSDAGHAGLLFPRYRGGSLTALLARRSALEAGEAVNILAPVASAVEALHTAGFAHGSLGPSRVLFDEEGTPMLIGLGYAARGTDALTADRAELVQLIRVVLERVHDVGAESWTGLFVGRPVADMVAELFRLADPLPVQLYLDREQNGQPAVPRLPARTPAGISAGISDGISVGSTGDRWAVAAPAARGGPSAPGPRHRRASEGPFGLRPFGLRPFWKRPGQERPVQGRPGQERPVKKWIWLLAAAGGAAAATAISLSAAVGAPTQPNPTGTAGSGAIAATPAATATPVAATAAELSAIRADDPVLAADALLALRRRCFAAGAARCLRDVDQEGGFLIESDARALDAGVRQPEDSVSVPPPGGLSLVQRNGDLAVVGDDDRTLLLLNSETGWRLRDLFLRN